MPTALLSGADGRLPRAVILGCAGATLTDEERRFFESADPLGFILFRRNCVSPDQVRKLVAELRAAVGRDDAPVLIDQEGGRVARLCPPHWPLNPPARSIGDLWERDRDAAVEAAWLNARLIAAMLTDLGISVDCAPVRDVPVPGAHDIIGDRAFGSEPETVAALGRAACDGFLDGGVMPVVKHVPGHGRAAVDSHEALPRVYAKPDLLGVTDFAPFAALSDAPWAMVAHVLYDAFDPEQPASQSPTIVQDVIRGAIGYSGVLVVDDLSMKALTGSLAQRAHATFAAGIDLALHCNGMLDEMQEVVEATPRISAATMARLNAAQAQVRSATPFDTEQGRARLGALLATVEVA